MTASERGGFSLIEVIFAMVILSFGLLALAAGSSWSSIQVRSAAIGTQRSAAIASVIEQLKARAPTGAAFDTLQSVPSSAPLTFGSLQVWYTITDDPNSVTVPVTGKIVTVFTKAPSYQRSSTGWSTTATEAFVTELIRPCCP